MSMDQFCDLLGKYNWLSMSLGHLLIKCPQSLHATFDSHHDRQATTFASHHDHQAATFDSHHDHQAASGSNLPPLFLNRCQIYKSNDNLIYH